jgi:excisionase family DNA binding protein
MKAVSNPSNLKTPVRPLKHGRLARQIEHQLTQRSQLLFDDPLLPLSDVAVALGGVSYSHLQKLIKNGTLKVFRIGRGHRRVRQSVLQELLAKGDQQREVQL